MRVETFEYAEDATLDVEQVVLVSTITGGTVIHHPDATDAQIADGLAAVFAAAAERHGRPTIAEAMPEIVIRLDEARVA